MSRDDELRAILEYCEAATAGEWEYHTDHPEWVWGPDGDGICECWGNLALGTEPSDDATFIARARIDLPAVVKELLLARGLLIDWCSVPWKHTTPEMVDRTRAFLGGDDEG